MSDWKEFKLGEIAEINMGQSPESRYYNIKGEGLPFLQGNRTFGLRHPSFDTYCTDPKKIAKRGEILFSVRAPVGDINIATTEICIGRGLASLKSKFDNNVYLFYLLHYIKREIINNESGTVFGSVNKIDLENIKVLIPDINEQNEIAEILSSLDDKINLLHRQNKTLEQIAETLFRQWFVEEAEDSWEEKNLDDIAEFLNGLACQKYPIKIGEIGLPVIKIKELRTGITESSDKATYEIPEKFLIKNGDMLFSWSGSLDVLIWSGGEGVLNQHLFKVSSDEYSQWFYYFWVKYHLPEFQDIALDKATTMGHIQRHHLSDAKVLIPPKFKMKEMDEIINPIFEKIKLNQIQIHSLTKLRDTQLPKLMSGEVMIEKL